MSKIMVLFALLALVAPAALADQGYPETIPLPNGFAPEGIEIAQGKTFYTGSVATGAIYAGNLRTGEGDVIIPGAAGSRAATGIEYDHGRLWVAGAGTGKAFIYDVRSRTLIREVQLGTAPTFINDVVVTKDAAYFTDSQQPVIYRVAVSKNGQPGEVTTITLSGDYQHVAGQFNLNGIVATENGKHLVAVQSIAKKLFVIDPTTGATKAIDIGTYDLVNGDGLLLHGKRLYVVQNRANIVAEFRVSSDLTSAALVRTITKADEPDFDVPTTIDRAGKRLYVVNARFGTTTPTDQSYDVVQAG